MPTVIQVKRGTAAAWTSANTTLTAGEIGFESDTKKMKVGDGSTAWTALGYTATDGDITAVVAGTGLSGGSTSGSATLSIDTATTVDKTTAQTLTNKTLTSPVLTTPSISTMTTTGDILYASSANTPARLGIGSTGQSLVVAAGVPSWATPAGGGSMTLLSTTTLSGATTTVSSISQSYKNLYIEVQGMTMSAFNPTINYLTNATATRLNVVQSTGTAGATYYTAAGTLGSAQNYTNTGTNNAMVWQIFDYTNALYCKVGDYNSFWHNEGGAPIYVEGQILSWHTGALTSVSMTVSTGTFAAGTMKIYGVN